MFSTYSTIESSNVEQTRSNLTCGVYENILISNVTLFPGRVIATRSNVTVAVANFGARRGSSVIANYYAC